MTQDSDRQSTSSSKRSARAGRNRPVLVTSSEGEGNERLEESSPTLEESRAEVEAQNVPVAAPKRRMPAFFSTVGKRTRAEESQETEQAQARIARATRNKTVAT